MKIFVYGAGVLGSLLAARLTQAGQDVYLLARGNCLVDLRQNGIRLQDMLTGQQENVQINLVERLAPQDAYDLVLVVIGKYQVPAVLPVLATNIATTSVLLIGHNAAGPPEITAAMGMPYHTPQPPAFRILLVDALDNIFYAEILLVASDLLLAGIKEHEPIS